MMMWRSLASALSEPATETKIPTGPWPCGASVCASRRADFCADAESQRLTAVPRPESGGRNDRVALCQHQQIFIVRDQVLRLGDAQGSKHRLIRSTLVSSATRNPGISDSVQRPLQIRFQPFPARPGHRRRHAQYGRSAPRNVPASCEYARIVRHRPARRPAYRPS